MKKLIAYASVAVAAFAASCDDFGDINKSPNATETPLTSTLLTSSLSQLGSSVTTLAAFTSGLYAQYFSLTQYTEASLYSTQDATWNTDLAGPMQDLQTIIDLNTGEETKVFAALQGSNANQIAIARILKAYRFSILTDRYGDMPYFGALKQELQPAFDTQEDIYKDIFKELDEAVVQFEGLPVNGDILFAGDTTKWQKFANSWRLILALRVSKANPALGEAQFLDALASRGGIIEDNSFDAVLTYPGGDYKNPWYNLGSDQGVSTTIADFLNETGDNRALTFGNAVSGTLIGVPYGLKREDAILYTNNTDGWSLILNNSYRAETSDFFVLTSADVVLALAEGAARGWITDYHGLDANALYNAAIMESWIQWDVFDQDDYDAYITNPEIDVTGLSGQPLLDKIAVQRWVTFYPNGPQGWAEWRRTGLPALSPTPNAVNPTKEIPRRFKYPSGEYGYNPDNVAAAVQRLTDGDTDVAKIWLEGSN